MRTSGSRSKKPYNWNAGNAPPTEGVCTTCNQVWPEVWDRTCKRPTPVHCTGTTIIFGHRIKPNPHHGFVKYPPCWRCNYDAGCDQCAGQYPVCQRCAVHVTPAGLAVNGPIVNTPELIAKRHGIIAGTVDHYPLDFQAAYRAANHAELDVQAQRLQRARDPLRAALAIAAEVVQEPTVDELRRKQELEQQAALVAAEVAQEREIDEPVEQYEEF